MQINKAATNNLQGYKNFAKVQNKLANSKPFNQIEDEKTNCSKGLVAVKPSMLKSYLSKNEIKVFEEVFGLVYDSSIADMYYSTDVATTAPKLNLVV